MNKNPKLLILLGAIALILIVGFLWVGHSASVKPKQVSVTHQQAFDVASGDTNNEVLKSIVAKQQALAAKNKALEKLNTQLQEKNQQKDQSQLQALRASLLSQIQSVKVALNTVQSHQRDSVSTQAMTSKTDRYPVGADQQGSSVGNTRQSMITTVPDLSASVSPSQASGSQATAQGVLNKATARSVLLPHDQRSDSQKKKSPRYTVPDGSTVSNVRLLSPLLGEVPVNGQLKTPAFPFKAIISTQDTAQMFAANGIPLPRGLAGTVLQGYSVGNMSLGCARAYVMKILFVFHDGHFVVYPNDSSQRGNSATQVYPHDAIGYLSNPYNNPCINGKYLTDAPKVIASLMAFGTAAGVGGAIAQSQTQTLTNISQGTTGTIFNGNLGQYAAGVGIGEGAKAALKWYSDRVGNITDAVFVPSTLHGRPRQLIFNVTQTLPIDLNFTGRTLAYEQANHLSATDTSFE